MCQQTASVSCRVGNTHMTQLDICTKRALNSLSVYISRLMRGQKFELLCHEVYYCVQVSEVKV